MAKLYLVFVDTPGLFAGIIRRVIRQKYIHVAISLDADLDETYSIGRRHPSIPLLAGFEREDKEKILRAFPGADYMVCSLECTPEQKARVEEQLREAMENRFQYHYAVIGLPFILLKKPFYQKRHYTCSSYIARLLEESGICSWDKHFSLVTPKDFFEYEDKQKIFEGSLRELTDSVSKAPELKRVPAFLLARPAFAGTAYMKLGYRYIRNLRKRGTDYER